MGKNTFFDGIDYNPWAGLSAYQDPETADVKLMFCGRKNESYDVANLIDNNIFVTIYGKSGTGKTSLLNAGVFPLLRKSNYLPVSVRLGTEDSQMSFQKCIISKIEQTMAPKGCIQTVEVVSRNDDETSTEYLWRYFACNRFLDHDGRVLFPVIVLDQFEEVLRSRYKEVAVLLRQIYFLMDENHALSDMVVRGVSYVYDFNFRFVVAIREDDLYRLEDCIDSNYLVNMKHGRYRLRHLSNKGIRDAILIPGDDLFLEDERDAIVEEIKEGVDPYHEEGGVSTNLLSLVCSRLFIEARQAGMTHITLDMVKKFVKGNPYEKFYRQASKNLSHRERLYIEQNLVDSENRRDSVSEKDFEKHVKHASYLFEGEYRILQKVSSSSGGVRVELIHDSFAEHLGTLKKKREKTRKIKFWATVASITLLYILAGTYLIKQRNKIDNLNINMESKELVTKVLDEKVKLLENKVNLLDNAFHLKDSTLSVRDIALRQKDAEIRQKSTKINQKDAEIRQKSTKINQKDAEIRQKDAQLKIITNELNQAKENYDKVKAQIDSLFRNNNDSFSNIKTTVESEELRSSVDSTNNLQRKSSDIQKKGDNSTNQSDGEDEPVYVVDGIEFNYPDPTLHQVECWKAKNDQICNSKVEQMGAKKEYHIPSDMIELNPSLVYLVLTSNSIGDPKEKQSWFDLYSLMNQDQINKLYSILLRERYKLAEIEDRYQKKQEEINRKYKELGL